MIINLKRSIITQTKDNSDQSFTKSIEPVFKLISEIKFRCKNYDKIKTGMTNHFTRHKVIHSIENWSFGQDAIHGHRHGIGYLSTGYLVQKFQYLKLRYSQ